jgi:hypothetical protein
MLLTESCAESSKTASKFCCAMKLPLAGETVIEGAKATVLICAQKPEEFAGCIRIAPDIRGFVPNGGSVVGSAVDVSH